MKCGKPIRYAEKEFCYDCQKEQHLFDKGISLWLHREPVNQSIYQFKYHNQREFAKYYAEEIVKRHGMEIHKWNPDLIIPVPLHWRRKRRRGYNQSAILADEIGKRMKVPVKDKIVERVRYTDPQKKLDHNKRKANLRRAFRVKKIPSEVKKVVVVDDIYTTGNTIDAIAGELKKKGVEKVYFLTISIGQGY